MKKNPLLGIVLGIGFMVIGVLRLAFPEWTAVGKSGALNSLLSLVLFIAGLAQVVYIIFYRRGELGGAT